MALEANFAGLIALTPEQRRELTKMGDKSEAFCRQAVDVFRREPGRAAAQLRPGRFTRDLAALDALRPRLCASGASCNAAEDTEMALGSDLMTNALEGYAVLKVAGKGEGLDAMRRMLSARFYRAARTEKPGQGRCRRGRKSAEPSGLCRVMANKRPRECGAFS